MSAYWIAHVIVTDPAAYAGYQALAPAAFAKYGGEFLARGGASEVLEGTSLSRHVIIRFPDMKHARDCYNSPEYQAAARNRQDASKAQIVIVEGV